jgi:hypothetical protein
MNWQNASLFKNGEIMTRAGINFNKYQIHFFWLSDLRDILIKESPSLFIFLKEISFKKKIED